MPQMWRCSARQAGRGEHGRVARYGQEMEATLCLKSTGTGVPPDHDRLSRPLIKGGPEAPTRKTMSSLYRT